MKNYLISIIAFLALYIPSYAQYSTPIPLPKSVIHGQLENGMSYYLYENKEVTQKASFYFVQNVGAILENEAQNGLAHFLEHMAFNGSKHFPGSGINDMLERYGVKPASSLNAYTAHDETVYNISNIPTDDEGLLDSCLLVLHDWSGSLLLADEEIEAERGVIREEWRQRRTAQKRLNDQVVAVSMTGSRYSTRDVIGSLDVINNFEHEEIRSFYKDWYRPDEQCIIIVGDLNMEVVESRIKNVFSSIPLQADLPKRQYEPIADHKKMAYVVATDKEANSTSLSWMFKHDCTEEKNLEYLRNKLRYQCFEMMFNQRCIEAVEYLASPAIGMGVAYSEISRTKEVAYLVVNPKEGKVKEAFAMLLSEYERVKRDGFTQSELDRTKERLINSYQHRLETKEEISNKSWAYIFKDHFLKAEPVMSVEDDVAFGIQEIYMTSLEDVNSLIGLFKNKKNSIVAIKGPGNKVYPSLEDISTVIKTSKKQKLNKYIDKTIDGPLVSDNLTNHEIVSSFDIKGIETKSFVLDNGATVVIYPTPHEKKKIMMHCFSPGGSSLLADSEVHLSTLVNVLADVSGLGEYTLSQLTKKLAGKSVSFKQVLSEYSENMTGVSTPRDFEILLQLLYLSFEHPNFDKEAFDINMQSSYEQTIASLDDNRRVFSDSIASLSTNDSPRSFKIDAAFFDKVDYERATEIYRERFTNAKDFTFVFVGDIDVNQDLALITKYVGSITSINNTEEFIDHHLAPKQGYSQSVFSRPMEEDKSVVYFNINKPTEYSYKLKIIAGMIGDIMRDRYNDIIREQEGGSYGVQVMTDLDYMPSGVYNLAVSFECDVQQQEKLRKIVAEQLTLLFNEGVSSNELSNAKSAYLLHRKMVEEDNSYWMSVIEKYMASDIESLSLGEFNKMIKGITKEELHQFVKEILNDNNTIEVVMNPEFD